MPPGSPLGCPSRYDLETRYKKKPKAYKGRIFDVIFEDSHLIEFNKQAGYLTVPNNLSETGTLVHAVRRGPRFYRLTHDFLPCSTHQANDLATLYLLAGLDSNFLHVGLRRGNVGPVCQ